MFSEERLKSEKELKIEDFYNGLIVGLCDSHIAVTEDIENIIKSKIGIEYFGDPELYNQDVDILQKTIAPRFDKRELL